jgi:large subunit ribosomal protein L22
LKHLRTSPRKVRLVVDLVRGLSVENAITQLEHSVKHAARPVLKLLKSAVANAKQNHSLIEETLVIKVAFVDEAATLHRWMPRAMGRATPLRKRGSHVTLILEGDVSEEKKAVKAKKTEKKTVKKETTKKETVKKTEKKVESKKAVKK